MAPMLDPDFVISDGEASDEDHPWRSTGEGQVLPSFIEVHPTNPVNTSHRSDTYVLEQPRAILCCSWGMNSSCNRKETNLGDSSQCRR
jgi:hypothetical protein